MRAPASPAIEPQAAAEAVNPGATGTSGGCDHRPDAEAGAGLAELAYELLDAHTDTVQLIAGLPYDPSWAAHLDYLRALQRKGREMLARTAPGQSSPCRRDDVGSRHRAHPDRRPRHALDELIPFVVPPVSAADAFRHPFRYAP